MRIATIDLETDPFEHKRMIYPFVSGFYDGSVFTSFWSDNCVDRLVSHIVAIEEPLTIFAHNGGRFDFFYFIKHFTGDLRIVNNRIIQAWIGKHELRDSFAIMPFPLAAYKKTPIDYKHLEKRHRETYRDEITSYLRDDCVDLYTLCVAFVKEFGNALTIGGASMKQLKKFHSFRCGNGEYDARLRKDYYFGGRNQVFESGILNKPVQVYDVNSMYPHVMREYLHPVSTGLYKRHVVSKQTAFVIVEGRNYGAFPQRQKDGSLDFTVPIGRFYPTVHEYHAALDTGTFQPTKIIQTLDYSECISFDEFVTHFYDARAKAKAEGDKIRTIFYKFVLNSAYGKFAQNPANYFDWYVAAIGELPKEWHDCEKSCIDPCPKRWLMAFRAEQDYLIWKRPLIEHNYYNVATGASITGAARAVLLRGLRAATDPYYCDTDSIICKTLTKVPLSETELGAWKLEATGTMAAICGKKLYAIYDGKECIKKAHKGAILTGADILAIAKGAVVDSLNPVPSFKWDGTYGFTKRSIRLTGTGVCGKIGP